MATKPSQKSVGPSGVEIARLQAPFVVGVTGHRDLRAEDVPRLEHRVRHIFERLRERHPFTPFLVLSPLAEGADQLVARVALLPEIGARLVVPLPMPAELYEKDFETPEALEDFQALRARASLEFEVDHERDLHAIRHPGPARDRCYQDVGLYVARQSQILIALWDGRDVGKTGGTSDIVKFRTRGFPAQSDCDFEAPELFPVFHILTPRRSNPGVDGAPLGLKEIYPPAFRGEHRAESYYAKVFRNLEEFNRRLAEDGGRLGAEAAQSRRQLVPENEESSLSPGEALLLSRYGFADALAVRSQKQTLRAHHALHWCVLASFVCFVFFAHYGDFKPWLLGLAFLFLIVAVLTQGFARRVALDDQSLEYRALAEGARVNFFWAATGIEDPVPENYLDKQRTELDWIRNALRGWAIEIGRPEHRAQIVERLEFAWHHWAENQRRYFAKAAKTNLKRSERMESRVRLAMRVTFITAAGIALAAALDRIVGQGWWEPGRSERWLRWPIIAIDILLAAGALLHHFRERMAYSEHAKQYKRMHGVFENASAVIRAKLDAGDLAGARACFHKLGREALAENGDWVLLHRERPLELPHP